MIRKLRDWWKAQRGPAVRIVYLPGSKAWTVQVRYRGLSPWYRSSKELFWRQKNELTERGQFNSFAAATRCAKLEDERNSRREIDERASRVVAFFGRKIKW